MSILQIGERVGDRYVVESEVGRGGMQEVYVAHDDKLQRLVALKVPQDLSLARRFKDTAVLSARINHPNIAKTLDYMEDESDAFYMVEEFVVGDNLRNVAANFSRFDPHAVAHTLHRLARGVAASHRVGIVHRDLKPSNIMIGGDLAFTEVKITDFGIAKMAAQEVADAVGGGEEATKSSKTVMNALAYIAPEVIDDPHRPWFSADVWALGAIAYELLVGRPPFGVGMQAVMAIGANTAVILPPEVAVHSQFGGLAKELFSIILRCLERDVSKRLTAQQLVDACDSLCYLLREREVGVVNNYPNSFYGYIRGSANSTIFFHVRNVLVGGAPEVGTRVWFSKYPGNPQPRAIPVIPFKAPP